MESVRVQAGRRSVRGDGGGGDGGTVIENPRSARSLACFSCSPVPWEARDNDMSCACASAISSRFRRSYYIPPERPSHVVHARARTHARSVVLSNARVRRSARSCVWTSVAYIYIYIYRSRSRPANTKTGMAHPTGRATTTTTTTSDRDSRSRALIDARARAPDGGTRTTRRCTDCTRFRRR